MEEKKGTVYEWDATSLCRGAAIIFKPWQEQQQKATYHESCVVVQSV